LLDPAFPAPITATGTPEFWPWRCHPASDDCVPAIVFAVQRLIGRCDVDFKVISVTNR